MSAGTPWTRSAGAGPVDPFADPIARAVQATDGDEAVPVRISRRPSAYRSTLSLWDVDVHLADGAVVRLTLKHLDPGHADVARVRPPFMRHPEREADVYRLLDGRVAGTPRLYGAWPDGQGGTLLLLERVDGVPLWQAAGMGPWVRAATWLGGFHARFAGPRAPREGPVEVLVREHVDRWVGRAVEVAAGTARESRTAEIADRVRALEPGLPDRVLGLPTTLIHGEFYPANVMVRRDPGRAVCPIDWEMAAVGPGLIDLAALVTGWRGEDAVPLVDAYHAAWVRNGGVPALARSALDRGLLACRLHLALKWLGWSRDWTPPPEQAWDWADEAERLIEELEP